VVDLGHEFVPVLAQHLADGIQGLLKDFEIAQVGSHERARRGSQYMGGKEPSRDLGAGLGPLKVTGRESGFLSKKEILSLGNEPASVVDQ
jgi:hypothetical protein